MNAFIKLSFISHAGSAHLQYWLLSRIEYRPYKKKHNPAWAAAVWKQSQ